MYTFKNNKRVPVQPLQPQPVAVQPQAGAVKKNWLSFKTILLILVVLLGLYIISSRRKLFK